MFFLRFFVGAYFLIFGLDGFIHFLPQPDQSPRLQKWIECLREVHFVLLGVKSVEIISGILLIFGKHVSLALLLLLPVVYGIVGSHLYLNWPKGRIITLFTLIPFAILFIWHFSGL